MKVYALSLAALKSKNTLGQRYLNSFTINNHYYKGGGKMHNRYTNQSLPGARQQFEQEARLLLRTHPGYVMTILEGMDQGKLQRLKASADLEKELEVLRSLKKCLLPKEVGSILKI